MANFPGNFPKIEIKMFLVLSSATKNLASDGIRCIQYLFLTEYIKWYIIFDPIGIKEYTISFWRNKVYTVFVLLRINYIEYLFLRNKGYRLFVPVWIRAFNYCSWRIKGYRVYIYKCVLQPIKGKAYLFLTV